MALKSKSVSAQQDPRVLRSKERVLQAAKAILLEAGPRSFNIEAIAEKSGVAKMTIYRHWNNREELMLATFRELVPTREQPSYQRHSSPVQTLKNAISAYGAEFATAEWSEIMPSLLLQAKEDPAVSEIWWSFAESRARDLRALIQDCVDVGLIRDVDLEIAISQLMGPLAFRRFLSFETIDKDFCDALVEGFLRAHA